MTLLSELEELVTRARKAGDAHRSAMHKVSVDPDLTEEARSKRLQELTTKAHDRVRATNAEARALFTRLKDRVAQSEPGVPAPSDAAVTRIRGLLQRGDDPHEILNMAVQLGDHDAIEALRTEAKWANLGSDMTGFVRRADEASLPFLQPGKRAAREERLAIPNAWAKAKAWLDAESSPNTGPTLEAALSSHIAATSKDPIPLSFSTERQASDPMERAVERAMEAQAAESADADVMSGAA